MSGEQILVWIVIGGIAGIIAEAMVGGLRSGLIGAIVVGILGAIIGGWLFGVLGVSVGTGIVAEIIKALIGAVLLLLILRGHASVFSHTSEPRGDRSGCVQDFSICLLDLFIDFPDIFLHLRRDARSLRDEFDHVACLP